MDIFNLENPNYSYFIGFAQTDGHLSKRKERLDLGKFSIELKREDEPLLVKLNEVLGFPGKIRKRVRDTNFRKGYASSSLTIYKKEYILKFNMYVPFGKKSLSVQAPHDPFIVRDYIRGLIDADGSVGYTNKCVPFISFTTQSESLKNAYLDYLRNTFNIKKLVKRNARDGIYNVILFSTHAQKVILDLYYDGCLSLPRKYRIAQNIKEWVNKSTVTYSGKSIWSEEEDQILLASHLDLEQASIILKRSIGSLKARLWRLRHQESGHRTIKMLT